MARSARLFALLVALALVGSLSSAALADATYRTDKIELHAVDDAPLRAGFVVNAHAQGPEVYAHEVYVLNGAVPEAEFSVTLFVYPFDRTCSSPALVLGPTATFTTNRAGNGHGDAFFVPADAAGFQGTHGIVWEVTDGLHTYASGCETVSLD
jgi:hypothetical protein